MLRSIVALHLLSLLAITSPAVYAADPLETAILDAFSKVQFLHVDMTMVASRPGIDVRGTGQMLLVNDSSGIQFHIPMSIEFENAPDRNTSMEYLYTMNIAHIIHVESDPVNIRRENFGMQIFVPAGGKEIFDWLRERYKMDFKQIEKDADDPESKALIEVTGDHVPKTSGEHDHDFDHFVAQFDAETGILQRFEWYGLEDGGDASRTIIEYTNVDLNPDWDPNRLVFSPPVGAEIGELPEETN